MTIDQLQPYLTAITAAFSVATLGFIFNIFKAMRDSANDRMAVKDERLIKADEELKRTEKWADREKSEIKRELDQAKSEMDVLLKKEGIDLFSLALGKRLSDTTSVVKTDVESLIAKMQEKLIQLEGKSGFGKAIADPDWKLSLAMGEMASGSFAKAAMHFDAYSKSDGRAWEANFTRGVAHANARAGFESNLASLRAYNEAIALAPGGIDVNRRARMFGYRGAVLKRLNRLDEAESDLRLAASIANAEYEVADIQYNLACVFAMQGKKDSMMGELNKLRGNWRVLRNIDAHRVDYFSRYNNDPDFNLILSN